MEESGGARFGARTGPGPEPHSAWLTPILMVYYLCCWPQDAKSDSSSERGARRGTFGHDGGSYHRASDFFSRRMASSAVSLHLPSTSGHKKELLSAHRSHEEIGRRKSHHETRQESRYHSAPSVIDEVLHRRDWERSSRELHIPLRPEGEVLSASSGSPEAPRADSESSSLEDHRLEEQTPARTCKKHHTNIKSSKGKKERQADEDKDSDATEASNFYIGDNECPTVSNSPRNECPPASAADSPRKDDVSQNKSAVAAYRAKDAKQTFNESIRARERPRQPLLTLEEHQPRTFGFCLDDVIEQLESLDRSGATHHSIESRISLSKPPFPPPSVEAVGYSGGACYLAERRPRVPAAPAAPGPGLRARHASDGDILAPPAPHRPESGAFSESDLDLELEDEEPPSYEELHACAGAPPPDRKETAI